MIPICDPRAAYLEHQDEIDAAVRRVLDRGRYILGAETSAFESEFADWLGVRHVIGVASGTDALHVVLRALGVGAGDLVATVAHTAVATAAAIELAGATPIFVDIDEESFNLSPSALAELLDRYAERPIRAIVPVHLYGRPASIAEIMELAGRYRVPVIEDASQAHGARIGDRRVGSFGTAAAFSFYPTKNLGAIGDGGAIATDDDRLAEKMRRIREYGWRNRYVSEDPGMNSRLDELQAAILRVKLRYLDHDNDRRRGIAARYSLALAGIDGIGIPYDVPGHVYHQYVVRSQRRDSLRSYLERRGVGSLVHYPMAVHQQPAYAGRIKCFPSVLEATERVVSEILSIPMYPQLDPADAGVVSRTIEEWATERS